MNTTDELLRLIATGKEINRMTPVGIRQLRWRQWQEEIRSFSKAIPEIGQYALRDNYLQIHLDIAFLQRCLDQRLNEVDPAPALDPKSPTDPDSRREPGRVPGIVPAQNGKVRVFLSYLSQDESLARIVNQELTSLGVDRIEVFQAHDQVRSGTRWKSQILKKLKQSDWFLMIYTDPDRDWEWPIHEAVAFETIRMADGTGDNRLCCLHATDKYPRTLSDYQHHRVEVFEPDADVNEVTNRLHLERFYENESRVYQFLRSFIGYPVDNPIINDQPAMRNRLIDSAHRISTEFQAAITEKIKRRVSYPPLLEINVDAPDAQGVASLQGKSKVTLNEKSRDIFRIGQEALPWQDFLQRYAQIKSDADPLIWTQQLETAINMAANDGIPQANFAVLYSDWNQSFLRPVLTRQEIFYSGKRKFYVALIEQPAMDFRRHREIGLILAGLMLASRFRYEFLMGQARELSNIRDFRDYDPFGKESIQTIVTIEAEASQHGLLNPDALIKAFEAKDRHRVETWFHSWFALRDRLFELFDKPLDGKAGLTAVRKEIRAIIEELKIINSQFLWKAIKRYAQLVDIDLDTVSSGAEAAADGPVIAEPAGVGGSTLKPRKKAVKKKSAPKSAGKKKAIVKRKSTVKKGNSGGNR